MKVKNDTKHVGIHKKVPALRWGFALISAFLISISVNAQEKAVKLYSLQEAVDYAIQNNNSVKNARLDVEKAKAFNMEILTQGLPSISSNFDYNYYLKVPEVPAFNQYLSPSGPLYQALGILEQNNPGLGQIIGSGAGFGNISFVLPNTINTGGQLNVPFFDGRYFFGLKARKDLYKTSRLSSSLSEFEIKYTVTKAYYQAEAAQESKGLLLDNLKLVQKLLSDTRAVYNQGLTEEIDVNRLELVETNLQSQINLQNQMAEVGLANLKFQMGLPLDDNIILKDKLDDLRNSANLAAQNKFDAKNRIEYDLLTTAVTLKGYDVSQKKAGYYPTLGGSLNFSENTQTQWFGQMFKSSNWYPQSIAGISLHLPIYDSGLKGAQIKQAKLEQQKSINDLENFKNAAELQYQVAQSGFNSALADEVNTQKSLDLSQKIFNKSQIKFTQGVGSSFELEQSEQDYTTNQLKHIQSVMNLLNAKADLDKAMGVR